jgi:exo-beta-1,3-glucanase (GH17 family)
MRFSTFATALLVSASTTHAYWKGFNVGANNPDGSCKSQNDWRAAFQKLKSLPGYFTSVRLYASSDCNTLANAVPAAISEGMSLLVGVWTEDENHFTAEKNALQAAIKQYGSSWILAISVGSEDLYRKEADPNRLAQQIYDVRGMVHQWDQNVQVGHVDTWTAWVDGANQVVIKACDFVGTDGVSCFSTTLLLMTFC